MPSDVQPGKVLPCKERPPVVRTIIGSFADNAERRPDTQIKGFFSFRFLFEQPRITAAFPDEEAVRQTNGTCFPRLLNDNSHPLRPVLRIREQVVEVG